MPDKIKFNPQIHHRRSIRLKGYDYSQAGAYFITICIKNRECLFGKIVNGEMILNQYGNIAHEQWEKLPQRFPNFELDVFQIMPNHMHGIIVLNESNVGATLAVAQKAGVNPAPTNKTVGDMIGAYKSLVANECLEIFKSKNETMGKLWQRNFHEHIIRNEQSYQTIFNYIIINPATWETDKFFIA
jgi:REP element-mobilizing transposase RayT